MKKLSGGKILSAVIIAAIALTGCVKQGASVKEDNQAPQMVPIAQAQPAAPKVKPMVHMPPPPPEKSDPEIIAEAQTRASHLKKAVDAEIAVVKPGPLPEQQKEDKGQVAAQQKAETSKPKKSQYKPQPTLEPAPVAVEPRQPSPETAPPKPASQAKVAPSVAGVFNGTPAPTLISVAKFNKSTGLPEDLVTSVFVDDSDAWVGTNGGGVARLNFAENNWIITKKVDGLISDFVTDIAKYKGMVFVGTNEGVSIWDGISWKNKQMIEDTVELSNATFAFSDNSLWIAARNMRGGIIEFDGEKWIKRSNIRPGVILNNVSAMAFDKNQIWIGTTSRGLYAKRGRDWEIFSVTEGLASNFIYSIAVKEDKCFLGGCCGLSYYDGSKWSIFDVPDGLPHSTVNDVVYDGPILWIGSKNGLSAYNGEEFTNYYAEDGILVDNRVTSIFVHGDELWVGTAGGLSRLKKGE